MDYSNKLAREFNLNPQHSANIISLIDEGNTIPFIARYRKEMTGSCDDQVLREFADRLDYVIRLDERKEAVLKSIEEQGFLTDEIKESVDKAETMTEVEDIYRPYKPKRKTRATVAVAKGLQPLADIIWEQLPETVNIEEIAKEYISEEKGVTSAEEAISGSMDIIAEKISDDANIRKILREQLYTDAVMASELRKNDEKIKDKLPTYEMYDNYTEAVKTIANHRVLAINRGEKEECIRAELQIDPERPLSVIRKFFVKNAPTSPLVEKAGEDAYKRLIKPSVESEVRNELFTRASEQAIKMFEVNLRPLLLQPPVKNKVTLGLDPAYRTGCKIAVVDGNGNVLDKTVVYFTPPHENRAEDAKKTLTLLILRHKVKVISIGNGTASKESEIFVADLIKELNDPELAYMVVNEAGASVYSASKLAAEEFPDFDVAHRSAVSIARRLQDPLAELIKIDPKSIGVGQYQHDMPQNRLSGVLNGVVEDCVNSVGVDLNSASYSLLSHVSGLNVGVARNITAYRAINKGFKNRRELLKVDKLGPKAFEQCAGFLRIIGGENILDNTAVHPESYAAAEKLLALFKLSEDDVKQNKLSELSRLVRDYGEDKVAGLCGIGVPTLRDIVTEIVKPGRDIRDALPKPMLRTDIMDMKDLKPGMEITGTVRNVIDFGAFIDIGVHQDGLVHISQITDKYIKHPSEVLSVGEIVKVRVISVDTAKNRISLSMKSEAEGGAPAEKKPERKPGDRPPYKPYDNKSGGGKPYNQTATRSEAPPKPEKELTFEEQIAALKAKFGSR